MKYFMKRYIIYLFALLLWSSVQFSLTSCTNDVYSDDSGIKLPEREVIEVTPVMGSWKIKTLDANVETGIPQVDEAIKEGIMSNPLLVVFKNFDPIFTFGVKDVVIAAMGNDIPAGTYKYENNVLDYHMVVTGLDVVGIPDIDMEVSLPIVVSDEGNVITGTLDARPLVADQLQGMGIDPATVTVELVIALKDSEAPDDEEGETIDTPVTGKWNLNSLTADIVTGSDELNAMLKQGIEGNELLATLKAMNPVFIFDNKGKASISVASAGTIPAGTYSYEEETLKFNLELIEIPNIIPAISQELIIPVTISEDKNTVTGRLDAHFLIKGSVSPEQFEALKQAKIDLVIVLESAQE